VEGQGHIHAEGDEGQGGERQKGQGDKQDTITDNRDAGRGTS